MRSGGDATRGRLHSHALVADEAGAVDLDTAGDEKSPSKSIPVTCHA